ncbi:uncharacterized protein LOC116301224 isoform X2 [Actinia tenebrosa]|uniref:Uncharacterized protein LOC116301224 isoform X2 n=1 Tax=Actinia tenebrosa TaxID=6105 RepID=A0A6P8IGZ6_ACTTE|nr:uncharacterized protein LOC116301224 isoform X2 [Actinia tenebrosa]
MTGITRKTVFRYLVLIVLVSWTRAEIIPNDEQWFEIIDTPPLGRRSGPVKDFWIRVKEGTTFVDENIRIDTASKTERFHILSYDKVDEGIILNDFTKNWTIIKLPKKKQCFLQKLNPSIPPPQKLKSNIEKVIAFNGTNNTINIDISEKSSWKVKDVVLNRNILSNEMNNLCSNIPVYEIFRTSGQLYLQGLKRQGRSPSFRRAACGGVVCSHYWQLYCKAYVAGKGCIWVKIKRYGCQNITC